VVGAASGYSTRLLNAACLAVDAGAPLYTTVNAPWFHGGLGKSVAVSATIAAAIGWTTGTVAQVLGKPSAALGETLLRRLDTPAGQVTVVGDATVEIELARSMGVNSALVLSGATSAGLLTTLEGAARPDLAVADVAGLLEFLTPSLSQSQGARS
jgi:ribonucleotide monophosphatase NagD (HAD superfamily)